MSSSSVEGPKDWNKTLVETLWDLYLKGVSVDLKLEALSGDLLQIHSCIFHCSCSHKDARLLAIKLPYPKDIIEKFIEFLYTGSINELSDEDLEALHGLALVLNFKELSQPLASRLSKVRADIVDPQSSAAPSPAKLKPPLTSKEVYLKYKDSSDPTHKMMDYTNSTLGRALSTEPKLFAKPVKIKLSGDSLGIEKVLNVSVKESKTDSSLQIIQTPSSIKIKDSHKALRLQSLASKPLELLSLSKVQAAFESYFALREHMKTLHHKRFDSRTCERCGFRSYRRTILFHHAFKVHGIPPPKNVVFPKCGDCDYLAANAWDLQKHTKATHTFAPAEPIPQEVPRHLQSEIPSPPQESLTLMNLAVPIGDLHGVPESQTMYILTEDPSKFNFPIILGDGKTPTTLQGSPIGITTNGISSYVNGIYQ
ncbi:Centrosome-associated zinc finger protein CP190 [Caligus rogercresseyi]|uniref:Centrosome-associated zinc finger protein CP190 n=1 Tax=Caligus rogercresseyi TaxID=217165 RepID=A0A7T8KE20_CALRO|nr:Centrosome-associated zinc finger protein CP190 [Caligus rogercresseyi]